MYNVLRFQVPRYVVCRTDISSQYIISSDSHVILQTRGSIHSDVILGLITKYVDLTVAYS